MCRYQAPPNRGFVLKKIHKLTDLQIPFCPARLANLSPILGFFYVNIFSFISQVVNI